MDAPFLSTVAKTISRKKLIAQKRIMEHTHGAKSGYTIYNAKAKRKTKVNTLERFYPPLPDKKFSIIYADPPWHYNGKLQYDLTGTLAKNDEIIYELPLYY